jgi:hypothetical protein
MPVRRAQQQGAVGIGAETDPLAIERPAVEQAHLAILPGMMCLPVVRRTLKPPSTKRSRTAARSISSCASSGGDRAAATAPAPGRRAMQEFLFTGRQAVAG